MPGREYLYSFVMQNAGVREVETGLKLVIPTEYGTRMGHGPALFDLNADPQERENLYAERPEDVARLTAVLDAWRERYPTESTLGRKLKPQERADLENLGYLGGDEEDESSTEGSSDD